MVHLMISLEVDDLLMDRLEAIATINGHSIVDEIRMAIGIHVGFYRIDPAYAEQIEAEVAAIQAKKALLRDKSV